MNDKSRCTIEDHREYGHQHGHGHGHGHKRGPSSFAVHDSNLVFRMLKLKEGDSFLDLGCGPGDYALHAAKIVGVSGIVYALEKRGQLVDDLAQKAVARGLGNIRAVAADITGPLPIEEKSIDVCFAATVLHIPPVTRELANIFNEMRRVLKPGGRTAILECKKEESPMGPPLEMRLSPEDIEASIIPCGFAKEGFTDLGYNYLIQFTVV